MKISSLTSASKGAGIVAACAAVLAIASPALATVTYHYGGSPTPTNSRDGGIVTFIDQHAPITFDFTVQDALGANLSNVNIKTSVLSWAVSGGKPKSSVDSDDPGAALSRLRLSTDSAGNITSWNIFGSADLVLIPDRELQFYFDSVSNPHDSLNWLTISHGQNTGGAVSVSTAGSFVRLPAEAGVPEPATWGLMLLGFGAVGLGLRHRAAISFRRRAGPWSWRSGRRRPRTCPW